MLGLESTNQAKSYMLKMGRRNNLPYKDKKEGIMDVDQNLILFRSAIVGAFDENSINYDKLISNIEECYLRVSRSLCNEECSSTNFENFRLKSTAALLLCCPVVREIEKIKSCKEIQSVLSTFPLLTEKAFFLVIRAQKNYKFLFSVLQWIPLKEIKVLCEEYFKTIVEVTPLTLALTKEVLITFSYVFCKDGFVDSCREIVELFMRFYKLKSVISGSKQDLKLSGYYLLYLLGSINSLLQIFKNEFSVLNSFSLVPSLELKEYSFNLCNNKRDVINDFICKFLHVLDYNIDFLSVDIWISWNDILLSQSISYGSSDRISLQSGISFESFYILKNTNDFDLFINFPKVKQYVEQVSHDPSIDPDSELLLPDLITKIYATDGNGKLLDILLSRDNIFESEEVFTCTKEFTSRVSAQVAEAVLIKYIDFCHQRSFSEIEWKEVVLEVAKAVPQEILKEIIKNKLNFGLDEIFFSENFAYNSTAVFNQLASSQNIENCDQLMWLCLQSGKHVLQQAVSLTLSLAGIVDVMTSAINSLDFICSAKTENGISLLTAVLAEMKDFINDATSELNYIALTINLIQDSGRVNLKEILQVLVYPGLSLKGSEIVHLVLPLEILQAVVGKNVYITVEDEISAASLLLSLLCIIHASSELSNNVDISKYLHIRKLSTVCFHCIFDVIKAEKHEKICSLVLTRISELHLQPRCHALISCIMDKEPPNIFSSHGLLHHIVLSTHKEGETSIEELTHGEFDDKLAVLIFSLYESLQHCSWEEWAISMSIIYSFIPHPHLIQKLAKTISIFHQVLQLYYISLKKENAPSSPVLQHCFTSFATASIEFVKLKLKTKSEELLFIILVYLCVTVVPVVKFLKCDDADLASLFLSHLVDYLDCIARSENFLHKTNGSCTNEDTVDVEGVEGTYDDDLHNKVPEVNEALDYKIIVDKFLNKSESGVFYDDYCMTHREKSVLLHKLCQDFIKFSPICNTVSVIANKLKNLVELYCVT